MTAIKSSTNDLRFLVEVILFLHAIGNTVLISLQIKSLKTLLGGWDASVFRLRSDAKYSQQQPLQSTSTKVETFYTVTALQV